MLKRFKNKIDNHSTTSMANNIKNISVEDSNLFSQSTRKIILCYHFFGTFPLCGVIRNSRLRFDIRSIPMALCSALFVIKTIELVLNVMSMYKMDITIRNIQNMVQALVTLISHIFLMQLAYDWPNLLNDTSSFTKILKADKKKVVTKCNILFTFFIAMDLLNIILSTFYTLGLTYLCNLKSDSCFQSFVNIIKPVYGLLPQTFFNGFVLTVSAYHNFCLKDLFEVMLTQVSIYLTAFFDDFNRRVREKIIFATRNTDWDEMRVEYTKLVHLVKAVNTKISPLILLTYGNNLVFFCTLILMLLKRGQFVNLSDCNVDEIKREPTYNLARQTYLIFSISICLLRIFLPSLFGSRLKAAAEASALPLYEYTVSEELKNVEIERLILNINTSEVTLNGLDFFDVTKSTFLKLSGTIITYELVMLQFTKNIDFTNINSHVNAVVNSTLVN